MRARMRAGAACTSFPSVRWAVEDARICLVRLGGRAGRRWCRCGGQVATAGVIVHWRQGQRQRGHRQQHQQEDGRPVTPAGFHGSDSVHAAPRPAVRFAEARGRRFDVRQRSGGERPARTDLPQGKHARAALVLLAVAASARRRDDASACGGTRRRTAAERRSSGARTNSKYRPPFVSSRSVRSACWRSRGRPERVRGRANR
jgi:hypothetical protein